MSKAEHTPTPWLSKTDTVETPDGLVICDVRHAGTWITEANAKFIVCACNAHDDLLAACEWIADFVLTARDSGEAWCAVREQPGASEWVKGLRAAIAKAKEVSE